MADEAPPVYTLHYFPFSLYSLMSRFAFVLGQALNPETAPRLEVKMVNLHREENYSERYLTQVNPKGQVSPRLVPPMPAYLGPQPPPHISSGPSAFDVC